MKKKGAGMFEGAIKKFEDSNLGKTILDNIDDDSDDEYDETSVKPKTQRSPEEERLLQNINRITEQYIRKPGQQGQGRRKTKKLRRKFDNCVKAVRKTVKARKGSTKKQAAYAICTKTILSK